jgi:hypothetical protein
VTDTFNIPLSFINEYLAGEGKRLQGPLDDALIEARDGSSLEQVMKAVTLNIVPEGATVRGASTVIPWTRETCREYLFPPGDSTRLQPQINNAMTAMGRSASTNNTITSVVIQVGPD